MYIDPNTAISHQPFTIESLQDDDGILPFLKTLKGHSKGISALSISPDGNLLVSGGKLLL